MRGASIVSAKTVSTTASPSAKAWPGDRSRDTTLEALIDWATARRRTPVARRERLRRHPVVPPVRSVGGADPSAQPARPAAAVGHAGRPRRPVLWSDRIRPVGRTRIGGVMYLGDHGVERADVPRGFRRATMRIVTTPAPEAQARTAQQLAEAVPRDVPEPWLVVERKSAAVAFHSRECTGRGRGRGGWSPRSTGTIEGASSSATSDGERPSCARRPRPRRRPRSRPCRVSVRAR